MTRHEAGYLTKFHRIVDQLGTPAERAEALAAHILLVNRVRWSSADDKQNAEDAAELLLKTAAFQETKRPR